MGPPQRQMVPQSAPPHIQQQNNFTLLQSPPTSGTPGQQPQQQSSAPNSTPGTPVRMQQFVVNHNHVQQQQQMFTTQQSAPTGVRIVGQPQQQQQMVVTQMQQHQQQTTNGVPSVLVQQQQQRMVQPNGVILNKPQQPTPAIMAKPLHVQRLESLLDVNPFLDQLEKLLSSPIRIPNRSLAPASGSNVHNPPPNSVFSVKGIWSSEAERRKELCKLHNFNTLSKRQWLKDVLLEESDSESDGDQPIADPDLNILLKIHRCRRKYQKKYHTHGLNSQYTYYGGGLLSEVDRFPQHQQQVLNDYGCGMSEHGDDETGRPSTSLSVHSTMTPSTTRPPTQQQLSRPPSVKTSPRPPNVVYVQQQQQQQRPVQIKTLGSPFPQAPSPSTSSVPASPLTTSKMEMLGMPMSSSSGMISMGVSHSATAGALLEDAVDPLLEE